METYAIGEFSTREVSRALKNSGVDKATEVVLKFINSSRIKVEEQDRLKKGEFSLEDYHFTDAAKERLQKELAVSVHIMNAMRFLYEKELKETNNKESMLESMYAVLCEWTHPSQTSLFHAHVPETHEISTSIGIVNLFDNARLACSHAMLLLCGLSDLLENIAELAREIKLKGVAT